MSGDFAFINDPAAFRSQTPDARAIANRRASLKLRVLKHVRATPGTKYQVAEALGAREDLVYNALRFLYKTGRIAIVGQVDYEHRLQKIDVYGLAQAKATLDSEQAASS